MNNTNMPYSLSLWGSNPDTEDNDDCWTGVDFATLEEACDAFRKTGHMAPGNLFDLLDESDPAGNSRAYYATSGRFVMLDGPDVHLVAPCKNFDAKLAKRENAEFEREWKSEAAMTAGMAFGCAGYNDEMGY